jgi:hypothetical protein
LIGRGAAERDRHVVHRGDLDREVDHYTGDTEALDGPRREVDDDGLRDRPGCRIVRRRWRCCCALAG